MSDKSLIWRLTTKKAEELIQRLQNHEYEVKPKDNEGRKLARLLGIELNYYGDWRHIEVVRSVAAVQVVNAFNEALAYGVIEPSDGIFKKYQDLQQLTQTWEEMINTLTMEKQTLNDKLEACHKRYVASKDTFDKLIAKIKELYPKLAEELLNASLKDSNDNIGDVSGG